MSAPDETGRCSQCGGDLTLSADETSWQCEADACALRGRPQAAVTDEDREAMRAFGSLDEAMQSLFGPDGPALDAPVTFHASAECPLCGTPVSDEPGAEGPWHCSNETCELHDEPPLATEEAREQRPGFDSIEDVYRTFFAPPSEPEPERRRRWPFGRRR